MKGKVFAVSLDLDLADWVRREAMRRRCSLARVIKDLILERMVKDADTKTEAEL